MKRNSVDYSSMFIRERLLDELEAVYYHCRDEPLKQEIKRLWDELNNASQADIQELVTNYPYDKRKGAGTNLELLKECYGVSGNPNHRENKTRCSEDERIAEIAEIQGTSEENIARYLDAEKTFIRRLRSYAGVQIDRGRMHLPNLKYKQRFFENEQMLNQRIESMLESSDDDMKCNFLFTCILPYLEVCETLEEQLIDIDLEELKELATQLKEKQQTRRYLNRATLAITKDNPLYWEGYHKSDKVYGFELFPCCADCMERNCIITIKKGD